MKPLRCCCAQTSEVVKRFYACLEAKEDYSDDAWRAWQTSHPSVLQDGPPSATQQLTAWQGGRAGRGGRSGGGGGGCFKCVRALPCLPRVTSRIRFPPCC